MLSKICCFNTALCKCHCWGLTRNKNVKIGYLFLLFLAYGALLATNSAMRPHSLKTVDQYGCREGSAISVQFEEGNCVEEKNSEVFFLSLGLMHMVLFFCMLIKSDRVKIINEGIWLIKASFVVLLVLFFRLIVGTSFLSSIVVFSIWVANLLYLLMGLVVVDLVYALDATLDQCSKNNKRFYIIKAAIALALITAAAYLTYLSFQLNPLWVSWTNSALLIVFLIVALLRVFPQNSILVAALVSLCLSVISFYLGDTGDSTLLDVFKGSFLTLFLVGMLCQGSNMLRTRKSSINQLLALNTTPNEEDNRYVSSNKWTIYHLVMCIVVLGVPALFFQQRLPSSSLQGSLQVNKVVWWAGVLCSYLWSLLAMKLFPSQDFSDLQNYFREYELK